MAAVKGAGDRAVGCAGCSQSLHSILGAPTTLLYLSSPLPRESPEAQWALLRGQLSPASRQMRSSVTELRRPEPGSDPTSVASPSSMCGLPPVSKPELPWVEGYDLLPDTLVHHQLCKVTSRWGCYPSSLNYWLLRPSFPLLALRRFSWPLESGLT